MNTFNDIIVYYYDSDDSIHEITGCRVTTIFDGVNGSNRILYIIKHIRFYLRLSVSRSQIIMWVNIGVNLVQEDLKSSGIENCRKIVHKTVGT